MSTDTSRPICEAFWHCQHSSRWEKSGLPGCPGCQWDVKFNGGGRGYTGQKVQVKMKEDNHTYGWVIRGDVYSTILRSGEVNNRFVLYTWLEKGRSALAEGSLSAVLAAARLLLDATDKEINELREIYSEQPIVA